MRTIIVRDCPPQGPWKEWEFGELSLINQDTGYMEEMLDKRMSPAARELAVAFVRLVIAVVLDA